MFEISVEKKVWIFFAYPQSIVLKGKTILLTNEDHKKVVTQVIGIIEYVNAPFATNEQHFVLVGDL
jgi:hypothetical protein